MQQPADNAASINYQIDGRGPTNQDFKIMGMTAGEASRSLVKPAGNAQVAAAAAASTSSAAVVESSSWTGTPYMSKAGNPIVSKSVVVKKGKGAGKSRIIYAEWISTTGKYRRISLQEITTGKKPKRAVAAAAPRRTIRKSSKKGGKKTEVQKARAKFMRGETAEGRRRDRKLRAPLVKKARDYNPTTTDMKGVDYPRKK